MHQILDGLSQIVRHGQIGFVTPLIPPIPNSMARISPNRALILMERTIIILNIMLQPNSMLCLKEFLLMIIVDKLGPNMFRNNTISQCMERSFFMRSTRATVRTSQLEMAKKLVSDEIIMKKFPNKTPNMLWNLKLPDTFPNKPINNNSTIVSRGEKLIHVSYRKSFISGSTLDLHVSFPRIQNRGNNFDFLQSDLINQSR